MKVSIKVASLSLEVADDGPVNPEAYRADQYGNLSVTEARQLARELRVILDAFDAFNATRDPFHDIDVKEADEAKEAKGSK